MEFSLREYKCGDEEFIIELFNRAFNRQLTYIYWKWRYLDNPNMNTNLINLAWNKCRLAAHYAVSPTVIFIDGKKHNSALSMTTMTDPYYRGKGLFTKLAEQLFEKSTLDVIYGVPNENSVKGFTDKLNFELIKEIPMFKSKKFNLNYKKNNNCVILEKFDKRFDDFFIDMVNEYRIVTCRNSEYLNWRFIFNPINEYKIFSYIENDKVLGYLVTKTYTIDSTLIGDIVDILVLNENILKELLNIAFSSFQIQNVSEVNTWFNDNELFKVLEEFEFYKSNKIFHFIVRDNSEKNKEVLFDYNNWYLTMSDIDLF
ncbi:hypothetical protein J2Z76_001567 [Sedimentibacter acidaminivorans]|uniref:N-acetyltransferase domain-containing protein n=1 Tax=Sedimentibacter acidaminivorans TaxID=913099 RepID=A0ABS4GDD0_9FIRM|nr:GNAT family N-acetyltransferase [Sedimentibacter acidaminivorans]MBP1925706.1 hypothetical protein [Sedimentibacter acidaminivorans]